MPAFMASRPAESSSLPSCGSITITVGFCATRVEMAARWAAASAPASTDFSSTSEYAAACALALLVIAAIQPWSAAGAEKPMVTFSPDAALGLALASVLVFTCAVLSGSLLVQAVRRARAPTAAPPNRMRLRDKADMIPPRGYPGRAKPGERDQRLNS